MTLFMWLLAEKIPAASDSMPKLSLFFNTLTVAMVAMVFGMSFVSTMHHKRIGDKSISEWLRVYVFEFLAYKLGVRYSIGSEGSNQNSQKKKEGKKMDSKDVEGCLTDCHHTSFNKTNRLKNIRKTSDPPVVTVSLFDGKKTLYGPKSDKAIEKDNKEHDNFFISKKKAGKDCSYEKPVELLKMASTNPSNKDGKSKCKKPSTIVTIEKNEKDCCTQQAFDKKDNVLSSPVPTLLELSLKDNEVENFHNNHDSNSIRETALIGNLSTGSISSSPSIVIDNDDGTEPTSNLLVAERKSVTVSAVSIDNKEVTADDDDVFESINNDKNARSKMCDNKSNKLAITQIASPNVKSKEKVEGKMSQSKADICTTGDAGTNKIALDINDKGQDKVDGNDTESIDKNKDNTTKLTEHEKPVVARPMPKLRNVGLHLMMNKRRTSSNDTNKSDNKNDLTNFNSSNAQNTLFAPTRSSATTSTGGGTSSSTTSKLKMSFQQVAGCAMEGLAKRKNELMEEKLAKERRDKRFHYEWRMCAETIDRMFTILFVSVFVIAALWLFHGF